MLDVIKGIINKKEEFLESAQIIYEDTIDDIENYIVSNDNQPVVESNEPGDDVPKTEDTTPEPVKHDDDDDDDNDNDDDNDDLDIMGTDINNPDALTAQSTDIFDTKLNDIAVSKDDDSDIFNVTIDIKTNTLTDVLPVPPMNAGDAVADDIMNTNISDGFTEAADMENVIILRNELKSLESKFPGAKKPMLEIYKSIKKVTDLTKYIDTKSAAFKGILASDRKLMSIIDADKSDAAKVLNVIETEAAKMKSYAATLEQEALKGKTIEEAALIMEAISIDAAADDTKPVDDKDTTTDDKPADTNSVTDAVIDKVNDVESTPAPVEEDDAKDKLLDKLDKLNKSVLDLKENIKKHIS